MNKTQRHYGLIFRTLRAVASAHATFTRLDTGLRREQFNNATHRLVCLGELKRVTPGKRGRFGWQLAVYSKVL